VRGNEELKYVWVTIRSAASHNLERFWACQVEILIVNNGEMAIFFKPSHLQQISKIKVLMTWLRVWGQIRVHPV